MVGKESTSLQYTNTKTPLIVCQLTNDTTTFLGYIPENPSSLTLHKFYYLPDPNRWYWFFNKYLCEICVFFASSMYRNKNMCLEDNKYGKVLFFDIFLFLKMEIIFQLLVVALVFVFKKTISFLKTLSIEWLRFFFARTENALLSCIVKKVEIGQGHDI